MDEQAEVFSSMTTHLKSVIDGGDPSKAAEEITALAEKHKDLKRRLSALNNSEEDDLAAIRDHKVFDDASKEFFETLPKLAASGKMTLAIEKALAALHDAAPLTGEGSPQ